MLARPCCKVSPLAPSNKGAFSFWPDALPSKGTGKATIWGLQEHFAPVPAAFANAVAVHFLDNDDCYLAAEYSHLEDNI